MIPVFANPLLLWGLAAAAVPVVIHLLNRRRYRVQRWAAMEWLLAAVKKNQKRLRMENLLLLLLRTFAVLFLALAVARPTFSDTPLTLTKQASHLFLLLDNSASMGARSGMGTAFDSALSAAASLLDEVGPDDPVTLVVTNDDAAATGAVGHTTGRARVLLRATHDHPNVRRLLSDLKPAAARADLVDALQRLEESVPDKGGVTAKVAILTDLQKASFDAGDGRGSASPDAALRATLARLKAKGADVVLTSVGRPVGNVAITALHAQDDRDIVQEETVVFEAEIRNFSDIGVNAEVRFTVDGTERGEVSQHVALAARPAGSDAPPAATAQYTCKFDSTDVGVHVLEARISADALPLDDVRCFTFEVRRPIRVLAVDGDPRPSDPAATAETMLLKSALAIRDGGPIQVETFDEPAYLAETNLSNWDLVVLANVGSPAPNRDVRDRLDKYVRSGGALMLTVGDRVVPEEWNRELWDDANPLLPARLGAAIVDRAIPLRFDLSENRHPILVDITNPRNAAYFQSPLVWGRMTLLDPEGAKGSRVVLHYTTGLSRSTPALVERSVGKGRVLLFTTTADQAWTKLSGDVLNPVLLHETVYYLTARGNEERNLRTFQPYLRTLPANVAAVEVQTPSGRPQPYQYEKPADAPPYVNWTDTGTPGPYVLTIALKPPDLLAASPPPIVEKFAVNAPPQESNLDRLRPEEIESRWPGLLRVASSFTSAAQAVRPRGGEMHGPLLIASILCLLAEVLLVRRIARTRTAAA